jgi:hypothetical protein
MDECLRSALALLRCHYLKNIGVEGWAGRKLMLVVLSQCGVSFPGALAYPSAASSNVMQFEPGDSTRSKSSCYQGLAPFASLCLLFLFLEGWLDETTMKRQSR